MHSHIFIHIHSIPVKHFRHLFQWCVHLFLYLVAVDSGGLQFHVLVCKFWAWKPLRCFQNHCCLNVSVFRPNYFLPIWSKISAKTQPKMFLQETMSAKIWQLQVERCSQKWTHNKQVTRWTYCWEKEMPKIIILILFCWFIALFWYSIILSLSL